MAAKGLRRFFSVGLSDFLLSTFFAAVDFFDLVSAEATVLADVLVAISLLAAGFLAAGAFLFDADFDELLPALIRVTFEASFFGIVSPKLNSLVYARLSRLL